MPLSTAFIKFTLWSQISDTKIHCFHNQINPSNLEIEAAQSNLQFSPRMKTGLSFPFPFGHFFFSHFCYLELPCPCNQYQHHHAKPGTGEINLLIQPGERDRARQQKKVQKQTAKMAANNEIRTPLTRNGKGFCCCCC